MIHGTLTYFCPKGQRAEDGAQVVQLGLGLRCF